MTPRRFSILFALGLVLFLLFSTQASAWENPWDILIGDYVWFDANGNGLQDDAPDAGINDVRVDVIRDYDCNGVIDGADEPYDYDYTFTGADGLPGFWMIIASSDFCYVAWINLDTVPAGLEPTTPTQVPIQNHVGDFWDADFGLGVPTADFACPKTIGFWKQQFKGGHSAKYAPEELREIVNRALALTPVFSYFRDFADILEIKGKEGPLARAKRQFAALTLNLAAFDLIDHLSFPAGLGPDTPLDLPRKLTDAAAVGEAYDEIEFYILNLMKLDKANDIADAINNGVGIEVDCEL